MMRSPVISVSLVALTLSAMACGQGTVRLGDDPVEPGDCPTIIASSDALSFRDAFFDLGSQAKLEVDNRCTGDGTLQLSNPIVEGDADVFIVPDGVFDVRPGARLGLEFSFVPTDYGAYTAVVTYATNDPAQPTLSLTLTGSASTDQDGDGIEASQVGGPDCDDSDAAIYPGREERDDGADQDCDGLIDEDFLRPGDVMLTEIFALPSSSPRQRQWFEVQNTSDREINLVNWSLSSAELDLTVSSDAVLEPGERGIFARSSDSDLVGLPRVPTGLLEGSDELMTLVGGWELVLAAGSNPVYILEGDGFPRVQEGLSLQLDPIVADAFESTRGDRWCVADVEMPTGERGTPFAENSWCPQIDHDGDGTPLSRDCDDSDPDRSPDATEVLDGIDNDCDGSTDLLEVPETETLEVTGFAWDRWWSMGSGDFDDDGENEVVLVSSSARRTHLIEISGVTGTRTVGSVGIDEYLATGWDPIVSSVVPTAEDVDGDGIDDIVMGVGSFVTGDEAIGLLVSTSDDLDPDIELTVSTSRSLASSRSGVAVLDTNGDGVYEVLSGLGGAANGAGATYLVELDGVSGTVPYDDVSVQSLTGPSGSFDAYGVGVATADLDDDGYDDMIARDSGRFTPGASSVFLIGGAARPGSSGAVDDIADTELGGVDFMNTTFPSRRPVVGDLDGDGNLDLAVPGSTSVQVWFDAADLLTSSRSADTEVVAVGAGTLCAMDFIDQDGDGKDGMVVAWSDAAWGGTSRVSYLSSETFAAAGRDLRPDRDEDGGVVSDVAGDMLGCGLMANDVAAGSGEELFVMAPQRRTGSTFNGTLWYFEAR